LSAVLANKRTHYVCLEKKATKKDLLASFLCTQKSMETKKNCKRKKCFRLNNKTETKIQKMNESDYIWT